MSVATQVLKPIAAVAVTAGTPVTVWTPAAGARYRLLGYAVSLSVAGSVILKNKPAGAAVEVFRTPTLAAGTGMTDELGKGILPGAAGDLLQIDVTANGSVSGYVWGSEE